MNFSIFAILSSSLFLVAFGRNDPNCGLKGQPLGKDGKLRIVHGTDAARNEFPWQGLFLYRGQNWCAGTIINSRWILSAAHCIIGEDGNPPEAKDFVFVGGKYYRNIIESTDITRSVSKIIIHPRYNNPTQHNNDAVLFHLDQELPMNLPQIGSICLPPKQRLNNMAGHWCTLVGWVENGNGPLVLQKATSFVWLQNQCKRATWRPFTITDKMMCWGDDRVSGCTGDSGGGLVCRSPFIDGGRWYQYGVVSAVNGPNGLCAETFLARTSELSKWVWSTIAGNSN